MSILLTRESASYQDFQSGFRIDLSSNTISDLLGFLEIKYGFYRSAALRQSYRDPGKRRIYSSTIIWRTWA